MYRPQFAFELPASPCEDQRCTYSFDSANIPKFTGTLSPGQTTGRIPLRLDKDADFYLRGVELGGRASMRLEDPDSNTLSDSDNQSQTANYVLPVEYGDTSGAGLVALESSGGGVYARAGSVFVVLLYNATVATINLSDVVVNLHGVKRYPGGACK